MDRIKKHIETEWSAVQEKISSALLSDIDLLNSTNKSILSNSGKQLRPLLAILFARLCTGGCSSEATVRYAAASELLHNATLLHDDVADESSQRRGVPTIMSLMGSSVSVLVGDYWLVKAMQLILQSSKTDVRAIKIFSKTLSDLAEGEMLQLQKAQKGDTTEEDYIRIIYNKTASLFEAACLSAVVSVEGDALMEKAAVDYSRNVLKPRGVPTIYINGEKISPTQYTKNEMIEILYNRVSANEEGGFACGAAGCG